MTIPCLLSRFHFVFHAGTWHGFWTSSSHGIAMAFAKKIMRFPSDSASFSMTNWRQKDMTKYKVSHLLLEIYWKYDENPVKNETRILKDSPWSFRVTYQRQFGRNWHQIPWHWPFHVIYVSRLCLFSMLKHDMDFTQGQVMELPWHLLRKWWNFHRIRFHF